MTTIEEIRSTDSVKETQLRSSSQERADEPIAPDAPPALQVDLLEALLETRFGAMQRQSLLRLAAQGPGTSVAASLRTQFPLSAAETSILGATLRLRLAQPDLADRVVLASGPAGWLTTSADGADVLEVVSRSGARRVVGSLDRLEVVLEQLMEGNDAEAELDRCAAACDAVIPAALRAQLLGPPPEGLEDLLYRPVPHDRPPALAYGLRVLAGAAAPAPLGLLPLLPVDDRSLACVVCSAEAAVPGRPAATGSIVRWHLDLPAEHPAQGELLDVDAVSYVGSVAEELTARAEGVSRYARFARAYEKDYLASDRTPRGYVARPLRLACQNVIVGQVVIAHASAIDGLAVPVWHSCEVPHLRAHEGVRGLAALVLSDAFHNGGTMEVSFAAHADAGLDLHPEGGVPAALRRFGRICGIGLGVEDLAVVTPAEARQLYLAVTPMPESLRHRVDEVVALGAFSPERLCYLLSSGILTALELEFVLGTSGRAASILRGGCDPLARAAAAAEMGTLRAALMVGMLLRRLVNEEAVRTVSAVSEQPNPSEGPADPAAVTVLEDERSDLLWTIDAETGVVRLEGMAQPLPWKQAGEYKTLDTVTVVPRSRVDAAVKDLLLRLQQAGQVALLLPADVPVDALRSDPAFSEIDILRCPETLRQLDQASGRVLTACRVGRA